VDVGVVCERVVAMTRPLTAFVVMNEPKRRRLMCTSSVPNMDMKGITNEVKSPCTMFKTNSCRKLRRL